MLGRSEIYGAQDLTNWAQFYLALAFAENLDASRRQYSIQLFSGVVRGHFAPPAPLLRRYLEALAISDPCAGKEAAELALDQLKSRPETMRLLIEAEIARHSPVLWEALYRWVCDQVQSRQKRFEYLRLLLREASYTGASSQAELCLDQLEHLATQGVEVDKYLAILREPELYDSAWEKSDMAWSVIDVLERAGHYPDAISLLEAQFSEVLHSERYGAREQAEEVLEELSVLPGATEAAPRLKELLDARFIDSEARPSLPAVAQPLNIVVVGGDERQSRLDGDITAKVRQELPNVTLSFRHTGWSSNWGDQFDDMWPSLQRADAVVILQVIRTNLGRLIRRKVPLWIGSYGRNPLSIVCAVRTAAHYAVLLKQRNGASGSRTTTRPSVRANM
jgi:hypothetical protein